MSTVIDDTTFWTSLKEQNLSENETLGNYYGKFDNMCSVKDNEKYCAVGKDQYSNCDYAKKLYHDLYGNTIKYENSDEDFATLYNYQSKFCNYLKYWLYDKIIFNKFGDDKIIEVLEAVKTGNKYQLAMDLYYNCNFDILELEKIKEIKLFYDYIVTYDSDKNKSSINDKVCGTNYKTTLNKMIGLYNNRNAYCEQQSNEYCSEFKECYQTHNVNKLCKLQCNVEGDPSQEEALPLCSGVDSSTQDSSGLNTPGGRLDQYTDIEHPENPSISITTAVVPTMVVLFVIFPILYKLTPVGSRLRKYILRIKNFLLNSNENSTGTIFEHISESDNENYKKSSHYLAYHSS
ncbi:PIR Superfamily Protein [Plasmodium ovale wallikeri]|uniref:PIR Superfamily Protein n=2 Tax=Plasmodium ovale TaxID=36330 RepID=A0A1A9AF73_PLAOA|nr:PIR Superfamily Protein [Plasmodium ovale wallikeri]SBT59148.1 PIR Superfamily Protein [Plasmodium ovale wallikeri]SBT73927.1 Plasmodium vivax Vir protein, putative [Plasmodium ovale]